MDIETVFADFAIKPTEKELVSALKAYRTTRACVTARYRAEHPEVKQRGRKKKPVDPTVEVKPKRKYVRRTTEDVADPPRPV